MTIWWWLVQQTATTAVLVLLVTLVCRLMPRRPALHHALWVVVLVKLLMPPVLAWPWSATELLSSISFSLPADVASDELPDERHDERGPSEQVERRGAEVRPSAVPAADWVARPDESGARPVAISVQNSSADTSPLELSPDTPAPAEIPQPLLVRLGPWLAAAWIVGTIVVVARQLRRIGVHWSLVERASVPPEHLTHEVRQVAGRLGMRPVGALVTGGIASPFVWCLGRLRIIWPEHLASQADLARLRGVIAHELAHVRRRDHWIAWLELFAGIVWWWHPLFWMVRRRLHESAEVACDVLVVNTLPEGRRAYAEALLELSLPFHVPQPAPALGVSTGSPRSFERRLTMILSKNVASKLSLPGFVLVGMLAVVAVPSWSRETGEPQESEVAVGPVAESPKTPTASEGVTPTHAPAGKIATAQWDKYAADVARLEQELAKSTAELHNARTALAAAEKKQAAVKRYLNLQESKHKHLLEQADQSGKQAGTVGDATGVPGPRLEITSATIIAPATSVPAVATILPVTPVPVITGAPVGAGPSLAADRVAGPNPSEHTQPKAPTQRPQISLQADSISMVAPAALASTDPVDITNLGIAIIESRGAVKLAEGRHAQLEKILSENNGSVPRSEQMSAAIKLETAKQKLDLLTEIAEAALQAAVEDIEEQQAIGRSLDELSAKGYAAKTQIVQAQRQVKLLQAKLKVLQSILDKKHQPKTTERGADFHLPNRR